MRVRGWRAMAAVAALPLAVPAAAQEVISGRLIDGTAGGGPGTAERVNLIRLGGGMSTIASRSDVDGEFRFEIDPSGPYLIQAEKSGVIHTAMVAPSQEKVVEVEIVVYETTTDTSALEVSIPHLIAIVDGSKLHVARVFEIANRTDPPRSIVGQPGALRFDMPADATLEKAEISSSRMPLRQEPTDPAAGEGMTLAMAIKPGITRYELAYARPYSGAAEIRDTFYHGAVAVRAFVLPAEIEVEASGLESLGVQEKQGVPMLVFRGSHLAPGSEMVLRLTGEGHAPAVPGDSPHGEGEIQVVDNRLGRGMRRYAVMGAALALLLLASVVALAKPAPAATAGGGPAALGAKASALLDELAELDARHGRGELDADTHARKREECKQRLRDELASRGPGKRGK